MTSASSNWLALQKSLGHLRKRRKVSSNTTSAFPRDVSSPLERHESKVTSEHVDLETTEVKNGESIAVLRRMVLGKMEMASQSSPGKYVALDCEMVGVGIDGNESSLARVSVVDYTGAIILDVFVEQREKVVDYRTQWSGIRSTDLASARPFQEVQKTVADLIKDRILVGHAVYNDLKALLLSHPSPQIRDTQSLACKYRIVKSRRPALRVLVKQELGIVIQGGEHSSVTDARATMALFRLYKKQWESGFRSHAFAHSRSKSKSDNTPANGVSTPMRNKKRKHSDTFGNDAGAVMEESNPSSSARAHSPSPSSSSSRTPTQHISTLFKYKRKGESQPQLGSVQRKGISSGMSTVTRRTGDMKKLGTKGSLIRGSSEKGRVAADTSKGSKKLGKTGGEWWRSLG